MPRKRQTGVRELIDEKRVRECATACLYLMQSQGLNLAECYTTATLVRQSAMKLIGRRIDDVSKGREAASATEMIEALDEQAQRTIWGTRTRLTGRRGER